MAHLERSREPFGRGVQVTAFECQLTQRPLALALDFPVLDVARNLERVKHMPLGRRIVGGIHADLGQMQQSDRFADAIADFAEDFDCLGLSLARAGRVAGVQPNERQRGQRCGDIDRLAQAAPELQALLQHPAGLGVCALAVGKPGADVQRVGVRDVRTLHGRQRKRSANVVAAFGCVSAQHPEAQQGDCELDCEDRIHPALQGERDTRADIVEIRFDAPCPLALFRALQPALCRLRHIQVVIAMDGQDLRKLVALRELLASVVANRFEEAESRTVGGVVDHHQ